MNERPLFPSFQTKPSIKTPVRYQMNDVVSAIWSINRHAKTSPSNRFLYALKREAIERLVEKGHAEKIGIDVFPGRRSVQTSYVVVSIGDYLFHIPPTRADLAQLPRYERTEEYRNPKAVMPFGRAKAILVDFTGIEEPKELVQPMSYERRSRIR